jgi:hypothetical protein
MVRLPVAEPALQLGEQVGLRGTRILGDVRRIDGSSGDDRVTVKVTSLLSKSPDSKAGRAMRGAWITCASEFLGRRPSANHGSFVIDRRGREA